MRKLAMLLAAVLTIELCCPAAVYANPAMYGTEQWSEESIMTESHEVVEAELSVQERMENPKSESEEYKQETESVVVVEEEIPEELPQVTEMEEVTTVLLGENGTETQETGSETTEEGIFLSEECNGMTITIYDNGFMTVTGERTEQAGGFGLFSSEKSMVTEIYCDIVAYEGGDSYYELFSDFTNVQKITFGENFLNSLGNVNNMGRMFSCCYELTDLDASGWNTVNVSMMKEMFYECWNLIAVDASGWNTANVTSMHRMFAKCYDLTTVDVSGWNTASVTDLSAMFYNCRNLTGLDVKNWNTGQVRDMGYMFYDCGELTVLDVSNWNTANVTDMGSMFAKCDVLKSIDVSQWNTAGVTDMNRMFQECNTLKSIDVSQWNTSNVENISGMFLSCESLTNLDFSNWDFSKVTAQDDVFSYNPKLHFIKTPKNNSSAITFINKTFYAFDGTNIDQTKAYTEIPAGNSESIMLVTLDSHVWSEYEDQEEGRPVRTCLFCGEKYVQTGVRLLFQDAYYKTENGYPLFAAYVIPKDTIPGYRPELKSVTLTVDQGEEKELTLVDTSLSPYYKNGETVGHTLIFYAGYDTAISEGEHRLTYKAVIHGEENGEEKPYEVIFSQNVKFTDTLGEKDVIVPLKSSENTQYMSCFKGSTVKNIYASIGNLSSPAEKIVSVKLQNHKTKKEVPAVVIRNVHHYNGETAIDSRYGDFVDQELGISAYSRYAIPKDFYGGYSLTGLRLTKEIPEGIYDVVCVSNTGRKYIFEEKYEATTKTIIWAVQDTKGPKASTDDGNFASVSTFTDNCGDYVSVFVYGLNLNKNNVPVFYSNDKTTEITTLDTADPLCGAEVWEYGIDYALRKKDPLAPEWETANRIPVKVKGEVFYAKDWRTTKPAEGNEEGFVTSSHETEVAYRREHNTHEEYFRVYLSAGEVKEGDIMETAFGSGKEYLSEAVVRYNGNEYYIEYLSDSETYNRLKGYYGIYVRHKGEEEWFWIDDYWDRRVLDAVSNITVPANCSWEIHPAKDVGNVVYHGKTTKKKDVLTKAQVKELAGKGIYRICIYNAKGELLENGRYLTYFKTEDGCKIKYVLNGGENSVENPEQYVPGQDLILVAPERYGYSFAGWYLDEKLTKKVTKIKKTTKGDVTLYAKWNTAAYSIEYNANGGSGKVKATKCKVDQEAAIAANNFKNTGYVFVGWNTKKDNTGYSFNENEKVINLTYADGEKIQLYAIWRPLEYTLKLDKNASDATFGDIVDEENAISTHLYEDEILITGREYERPGYTLAYWSKKTNGKGTKYVNGKAHSHLAATDGENVTLYAVWTKNTYTVTYDLDGGKLKGSNPKKYYVDSATVTLKEPSKAGYVFEGWYEADENGNWAGEKITAITKGMHKDLALVARWSPMSYDVELNPNTDKYVAKDRAEAKQLYYDCSREVSPADWTAKYETVEEWKKKGYGILYWSTQPNGKGKKYYDDTTYSYIATSGTVKLYAQWGIKKYTITYENAEGVRNSNPTKYTFDTTKKISLKNLTKKGYVFEGWYTDPAFTEESKVLELNCSLCEDITLYAKLTPVSYTVKLEKNGNDVVVKENTATTFDVNYEEVFALAEDTFTRPHYKIAYWTTNSKGTGKKIYSGDIFGLTTKEKDTVTLYPKWELVSYRISYENVDYENVVNKSPKSYQYSEKKDLALKNPTRPGYVFGGWYNEYTLSENFHPQTAIRQTKIAKKTGMDFQLFAHWIPIQYKIQLVANAKDAVSGSVTIGGTNEILNVLYEDPVTLAADSYARPGYELVGFSTNKNGKGTIYALGEPQVILSTKANKTIKLYAIWEKVTPKRVTNVMLTAGNGEILVGFDMDPECDTYEISYSMNYNMKDAQSRFSSEDNVRLFEVQPGYTYYIKVREIRHDSCNTLIKGEWSYIRSIWIQ